jgi:hypothetical protein
LNGRQTSVCRSTGLCRQTEVCRTFTLDPEIPALPARYSGCSLSNMIDRKRDVQLVRTALKRRRIVALLGPRQCGKTTLARLLARADSLNYFDLEDPRARPVLTSMASNSSHRCPVSLVWYIEPIQDLDKEQRSGFRMRSLWSASRQRD